jgi:hypothetical protein
MFVSIVTVWDEERNFLTVLLKKAEIRLLRDRVFEKMFLIGLKIKIKIIIQ